MSSSFTAKRCVAAGRGAVERFLRAEDGVALVEFAIVLPMMLLVFAVIIEGSRMMLSYESAINGVRDATRYLARTAPANLCASGASVAGYSTQLQTLVRQGVTGRSVFPPAVTVGTVTPSYRCVTGTYRGGNVPVAQVSAVITVTFPFANVFTLFGGSRPTLTTTVTDQARVFGS
jgi:Flp pilus assembly protein TadG